MTNNCLRHERDVFHSWMLKDAVFKGNLDMPVLKPVHAEPKRLISFTDAMHTACKDFNQTVHFFEDDYRIERFWNNPKKYVPKLGKFESIIGLDYSVCWDFPEPLKNYNYFRNNVCTYWMQQVFNLVIPQARCEEYNYKEVLAGHPRHSTIAIGARSMVRNPADRAVLKESLVHIIDELKPTNILWYSSDKYGVCDYARLKKVPITIYKAKGRGKLRTNEKGGD